MFSNSSKKLSALLVLLSSPLFCMTYLVTDNNGNDDPGTLGEALQLAGNGDIIDCSPIASQTINLAQSFPAIGFNLTSPSDSLTILGRGVTIDGNNMRAAFALGSGSVTITDFTIQNGLSQGGSGGFGLTGGGGGTGGGGALYVHKGTTMTISTLTLSNNQAVGGAGGAGTATGGSGGGGGGFGGGNGGFASTTGASAGAGGGGGGNSGGTTGGRDGGVGSPNTFANFGGAGGGGERPSPPSGARSGGSTAASPTGPAHSGGSGGTGTVTNGAGAGGGAGSGGSGFAGSNSIDNGGLGVGGAGGIGFGVGNTYGAGGGGGGGGAPGANGGGAGLGASGGGGGFKGSGGDGGTLGGGGGAGGIAIIGGNGGFGAGGGAGHVGGVDTFGLGGTGGSTTILPAGGGGGSALGGAIFIQEGAVLIMQDGISFSGSSTTAGTGGIAASGGVSGGNGSSLGTDIFIQGGGNLTFQVNGTLNLSNPIEGAGTPTGPGVTQSGTGTVSLNGTNTYVGGTSIQAGTLNLNGSALGNCTIASGGTLSGNATVAGSITNSGTILPGNSIGTITAGSVTFMPGSIFQVEINPLAASELIVMGTAQLDGSVHVVVDSGSYSPTNQYPILTASSIMGNFSPSVFGPFSLSQIGNTIFLFYTPPVISTISTTGISGNARKVANYLNKNGSSSTIALFDGLTDGALQNALSSASPARNSFGTYITQQTAFSLSSLVSNHLDDFRVLGRTPFEDPFVAALTADASDTIAWGALNAKKCRPICKQEPKYSVWVSGFGEYARQSASLQNPAFHFVSGAALAGIDYRGENRSLVGGAVGYAHTAYRENHHAGHGTINYYFSSLYGNVFIKNFYISPAVWGIFNQIDNTRHIAFPGFSANGHAHINGWQMIPHVEVGYDLQYCWGNVIPFTAADWAISWQRGYHEHGAAPFNARQKAKNSSMVRSETGVKFSEQWEKPWGVLLLKEKVSYVFEKPLRTGIVNTAFVGTPGAFTVTAVNKPLNLGAIGLNFVASVGQERPVQIDLGVEGEFGANYWSSEVLLTLSKAF